MQVSSQNPNTSVITPTEFEQLVREVFALVQRDRAVAEIDVAALLGKSLSRPETAQVRRLVALYFAEVATRAVDEQTAARPLAPETMQQWLQEHLRPAA